MLWRRLEWRDSGLSIVMVLLLCVAGCGKDAATGSVSGVVRLDGKPLTLGSVRFIPSAGRSASGEIQSDGTFTLGTYGKRDGAVIGMHRVTVIAITPVPDAPKESRMLKENPKAKPLVPSRYNSPGSSGLTFEVKPGDNHAEFDLTSR
jgi:hypothetical protein